MSELTHRLFIALNLPPELRYALHSATAPLRDAAPGRWVVPDNLHLTVKFLGNRPEAELPVLVEKLSAVAQGAPPARLGLSGIGGFPNLRRARVVWIGVEQDPKLELLQHDVETACAALGYEMEGRAFRPHITLGRLTDPAPPQLRALGRAAAQVDFSATAEAMTLDIMRSDTGGGRGSRYTLLSSVPLGGARGIGAA
jgi:RNA 2',3'-cyclic 3'-phosphodiesterase